MKYSEISERLANQVEAVCELLLPGGTTNGKVYCASSVHGGKGDSLKVTLSGQYKGNWKDFNPGIGGDLLDLWAQAKCLELVDAYDDASQWLGVTNHKFSKKEKVYLRPKNKTELKLTPNVDRYLTQERKLPMELLFKFKISSTDSAVIFNYIRDGELINVKTVPIKRDENGKKLPARFEKDCEQCLYGWDASMHTGRSVTLCEGELDAISLAAYGINALSVPTGASGLSWIENDYDRLTKFDTIYLCFDNDDAGQKGALAHAKRLGLERCQNVLLPKNDANECLQLGISKNEIENAFEHATSFDPDQLLSPENFRTQVLSLLYPDESTVLGFDSPWQKFNDKIFFDKSGLSVWTGVNGHGKTQFLNHLACHWMNVGAKVCIASLELDPADTMKNLISVLSCKNTNPHFKNIVSQPYAEKCMDWLENDRLWFYDEFGGANAKEILSVFQYAHRKYGIDIFVIDSLSLINIDDDDYNSQAQFVRDLVMFKKNNNCHIHLVVHPRKGADENQSPGKFDFRGSGTITNLADNCFSVSRNKRKELVSDLVEQGVEIDAEDYEVLSQADCYVWCMKQRKGGHEGKFGFWLNFDSKQYLSYENSKPITYVEFSKLDRN